MKDKLFFSGREDMAQVSPLVGVGWGEGGPPSPGDPTCLPAHLAQEMKVGGQSGRTGYLLSGGDGWLCGRRHRDAPGVGQLPCLPSRCFSDASVRVRLSEHGPEAAAALDDPE